MKKLALIDLHHIQGGDFQMVITGSVPTSMSKWVIQLFTEFTNQQITDAEGLLNFMDYVNTQGGTWKDIQIDTISYSEID